MNGGVHVAQPTIILWGNKVALACSLDGQLLSEELHGFFAGDTRVLSTYQIRLNGHAWHLLGHSRSGHGTAHWEFQNPPIRDALGDIPEGTLLLSLRRRVDGILHDDLHVHSFVERPVRTELMLELDGDFADIFEVQSQSLPPRLSIRRVTHGKSEILTYEHEVFQRGLHLSFDVAGPPPVFVGARVVFALDLAPGSTWKCCLEAAPVVDGKRFTFSGDPHKPEPNPVPDPEKPTIYTDSILERPFMQSRADLHALAVHQAEHLPYVAAGVPWFLTLFGRDALLTALLAGLDGSWLAEGALAALGPLQATTYDDWLDAQPGRIAHEVRHDELTELGKLPYKPAYYGTYDAPEHYCLALWNAWRWTGKHQIIEAHLETAKKALRWCDELGDRDADGLLEYATRSPRGLRNQSWKDSGEAVVHADGRQAEPPLATVELQGYFFAARLAMAEILTELGEHAEAESLRLAAGRLRDLVEERYWLEEQGFYAFALDYKKDLVASIASNPGHLLWCGLPTQERAIKLAKRFLKPDLFSGWGLRTLSSENPAYNPLSYQLGSVWPHDTVLVAAGLCRYGLYEEASTLIRAILEAANAFEEVRLPELFCGLDRSHDLPVPYVKANSPQAWAAATSILVAQLFLGLVPDAPHGRCFVSPWLPEWLPRLEMRHIAIGEGTLDIMISRHGTKTVIEQVDGKQIEVIQGTVEAPLWGLPPTG